MNELEGLEEKTMRVTYKKGVFLLLLYTTTNTPLCCYGAAIGDKQ